MMAIYKMRFMFDWCSGVCLWSMNDASKERFGDYPIETDQIDVSDELRKELERLIYWHDEALNWEDPASGLVWTQEQIDSFCDAAEAAYQRLCNELGPDYDIEYFGDNREDII